MSTHIAYIAFYVVAAGTPIETLRRLLEKGADPNVQDVDGNTMLHIVRETPTNENGMRNETIAPDPNSNPDNCPARRFTFEKKPNTNPNSNSDPLSPLPLPLSSLWPSPSPSLSL